jgi:hypothetical protein
MSHASDRRLDWLDLANQLGTPPVQLSKGRLAKGNGISIAPDRFARARLAATTISGSSSLNDRRVRSPALTSALICGQTFNQ